MQEWGKQRIETLKGQQIISQLESAIREIDEVGQSLTLSDATEFAHKISPHKDRATKAIAKFKESSQMKTIHDSSVQQDIKTESSLHEQITCQIEFLPEEIEVEQRRAQLETVQNLQHDMEVENLIYYTVYSILIISFFL